MPHHPNSSSSGACSKHGFLQLHLLLLLLLVLETVTTNCSKPC
jgi:hypothetical protein